MLRYCHRLCDKNQALKPIIREYVWKFLEIGSICTGKRRKKTTVQLTKRKTKTTVQLTKRRTKTTVQLTKRRTKTTVQLTKRRTKTTVQLTKRRTKTTVQLTNQKLISLKKVVAQLIRNYVSCMKPEHLTS